MKKIKISIIDNDYVVRAETDLGRNAKAGSFIEFLQQVDKNLIPGETAHLEIEGIKRNPITFEISQIATAE